MKTLLLFSGLVCLLGLVFIQPVLAENNSKETSWGRIKAMYGGKETLESVSDQKVGPEMVYGHDYIQFPINPWLPLNGRAFGVWVDDGKYKGYHLGDDCVRSPGTPVYAIYGGFVRYARYNYGGWGYLMIVESQINNVLFCTVYGHLGNAMYPGEGRWVQKGQYIGTVGATWESGQGTPHLHLGIHPGYYGWPTGEYPGWCRGYTQSYSERQSWFNPTSFISYW